MASFFSLFRCDSFESNREYENQFEAFAVFRDKEQNLKVISRVELEKRLIDRARNEPKDHAAVMAVARLVGTSLEQEAYDRFVDTLRLPVAMAIFFDSPLETPDESNDFEKLTAVHFPKYRLFKFASFLDRLQPGRIHWRGQAELEFVPIVTKGLDSFLAAGLQGRTSMLSRWIQNPSLSAFSEERAKQSEALIRRRAYLLTLDKLPPAEVARRLDDAGFKRRKKHPYVVWFHTNRKSFESWLSRERAESKRMWKPQTPMQRPKPKLS